MNTKYTKWPYIIPNGYKIYIPKYSILRPSEIGIYGMKTYHLATLFITRLIANL
jgi:hypothetical protein